MKGVAMAHSYGRKAGKRRNTWWYLPPPRPGGMGRPRHLVVWAVGTTRRHRARDGLDVQESTRKPCAAGVTAGLARLAPGPICAAARGRSRGFQELAQMAWFTLFV